MESTGTASSGGGGVVGAAGTVATNGAEASDELGREGIEDMVMRAPNEKTDQQMSITS